MRIEGIGATSPPLASRRSTLAQNHGHPQRLINAVIERRCKADLDTCKLPLYIAGVIRSFRDRALERFFETGDGRRLSVQNTRRIANILRALDDASRPEDMNLPGFRFLALSGRDKGRYAVNASGNWRVTFAWSEGDATDVDLEDYH
ncbi:MAG TPA: type II toxin-antitoxin system RelE/ParE family toxin [Xanthobacteraceae bacterium]|jgi:proteic killer suppression protein